MNGQLVPWKMIIVDDTGVSIPPSDVDSGNNARFVGVATPDVADAAATFFREATASTNAVNVKASPGNVYAIRAFNDTSAKYYLRMYNLAAAPTPSSATGFVETLTIPHASGAGAGFVLAHPDSAGLLRGDRVLYHGRARVTDNTNAATGVRVTVLYK